MTNILSTLRPEHPRLFLLKGEEERIRQTIASDPVAAQYYAVLQREGEEILALPPIERVFVGWDPNYMYMLLESRKVVHRLYTLGLLYRLTGEERWARRAIAEMLTVARFVDWNPKHWLDVAEMINAMATGYDWLYAVIPPAERAEISEAIYRKGLLEAESAYWNANERLRRGSEDARAWWGRNPFNWNNVCNAGILIGSLALADEYPQLAEKLIAEAAAGLPYALASYAPDGAWAEGPAYWGYATHYTAVGFAALETALGNDFGLSDLPGVSEAGWFRLHGAGPTGKYFNFADAAEESTFEPTFYYLALRYQNPAYARAAEQSRALGNPFPLWGSYARALLWYRPERFAQFQADQPALAPALDAHYKNTHVAFFRSAWDDPQAFYVGFKGGDNQANHAHLDLGVFVFDALGERWISDLCGDEYTLPGYFDKSGPRWKYMRINTQGHNTLIINDTNQEPTAEAPLVAFYTSADCAYAIADLTAGYAPASALRVTRKVELGIDSAGRPRRALRVEDDVETAEPAQVEWRGYTTAQVELNGATALLKQNGKTMIARLLEPQDAEFSAEPALTTPPQRPLEGMTRLMVKVAGTTHVHFSITLEEAA